MSEHTHDLIVIGAGPGGYVAAIRAAQLGLNVACIEREPALGGTCLRVGCIPSKALLESSERFAEARDALAEHGVIAGEVTLDLPAMLRRKDAVVSALTTGIDGLFRKNKITRYAGTARLTGGTALVVQNGDQEIRLSGRSLIIATGSISAPLPGVEGDGVHICTSTEALSFPQVPRHLVVIGAGYIGLELGSVWLRLGARVTVLEYLDRILPGMDAEIAADAKRVFTRQGFEFRLGSRVTGARVLQPATPRVSQPTAASAAAPASAKSRKAASGARSATSNATPAAANTAPLTNADWPCLVEIDGADPIACDRVLLAVGRLPNTRGLDLDAAGIRTDKRGRIEVDAHYATSAAGIYAIGDVIAGPMLAHKAEEEGVACVEHMVTGYGHVDYNCIPGVAYTHPEIASVGRTEEDLVSAGINYRKGIFHFRGNGRARALGQMDGRVKMLADAATDRILGVHIIGPRAGDLIAEAAVAMSFGASSEDIARVCHAHPTLAESLKEAALAVDNRAIHA